jgi:hypothetical protein
MEQRGGEMSKRNASGRNLAQDARMIMHEDEHAIVRGILIKALGDDNCYAQVVSSDRSESGRAEDRLVLARFFERMERQFALRAEARSVREDRRVSRGHDRETPAAPMASRSRPNGSAPAAHSRAVG